jgi:hypothetical protein
MADAPVATASVYAVIGPAMIYLLTTDCCFGHTSL